jgi:hypothetical protein
MENVVETTGTTTSTLPGICFAEGKSTLIGSSDYRARYYDAGAARNPLLFSLNCLRIGAITSNRDKEAVRLSERHCPEGRYASHL